MPDALAHCALRRGVFLQVRALTMRHPEGVLCFSSQCAGAGRHQWWQWQWKVHNNAQKKTTSATTSNRPRFIDGLTGRTKELKGNAARAPMHARLPYFYCAQAVHKISSKLAVASRGFLPTSVFAHQLRTAGRQGACAAVALFHLDRSPQLQLRPTRALPQRTDDLARRRRR